MVQYVIYYIKDNILLILVVAGLVLAIALWFLVRSLLSSRMSQSVYLCVEYYVRNCHNCALYDSSEHVWHDEHKQSFNYIKMHRDAWYLSNKGKQFVDSFLKWFDLADGFIAKMSRYMGDEHYFAHSEFLECMKDVNLYKETLPFFTEKFLHYVNKKVPDSYVDIDKYVKELKFGFSDIPQKHNTVFIKDELEKNKDYFDHVLKYPLDTQQRESIVKLEDNCLVVSSAGSGKTSTSVSKVKYLVEKRHVLPSKILPLTYTTKAAKELSERLELSNKGLLCHTFHSLAFGILAETTGEKPSICDSGIMLQCFYHLIGKSPNFKKAVNEFLTHRNSLTKNLHDYFTPEAYSNDRSLYGIQAPFVDMDGKIIFTRSEEEKKICTFLSLHNVRFRYEEPYQFNTATQFKRQYYPDFTIHFNSGGREYYIILEHFGIDRFGNVPHWFGVGQEKGYEGANTRYNEGIRWKRSVHSYYKTALIETTSAMFADGTIYDKLTQQLQLYKIPMRDLTEDEKFDRLVKRNKRMEDSILQLISTFITLMKSNRSTPESIMNVIEKEKKGSPDFIERSRFLINEIFLPMYREYQATLSERRQIDYTDLILKATDLCEAGLYKKEYDIILVDEFQDISVDRFKLLQSLRKKEPLTKLYCVGDDWQSIFRFSGSDLSLFNSFEDYFGFTQRCKIETTYRFGNPAVDYSSVFILRNDAQVPKTVHPLSDKVKTNITFVEYGKEDGKQFKELVSLLDKISNEESVMLIGRYHSDADFIPRYYIAERDSRGHISKVNINGREIRYNTVHSAKGLESDNIILVNCSQDGNGFPSKISDDPILGFVLSTPEAFPFAEERRLFYVAITRAKKHTFVMYKDTCPSPFVAELAEIMNSDVSQNSENLECPWCKKGILRSIKEGENNNSKWKYYRCTNNTAGCQYSWLVSYRDPDNIAIQFAQVVKKSKLRFSADIIDKVRAENPNVDCFVTPSCAPPRVQPLPKIEESPYSVEDNLPF